MNYSVHDVLGLLAGVAAIGIVVVLPGIAIAETSNAFRARRLPASGTCLVAIVIGTGVLPVIDSLLCRWLGLAAALAVNLMLAAYGLRILWRKPKSWPPPASLLAGVAWLALVIVAWIDFDRDGLYPSLLMIDGVKHAATVRALVESGTAPPYDPFFLRDDPAGYYYYYYVLSALAERLGSGWIDSRAAVGGQVFWTGIALHGLALLLLKKTGLRGGRAGGPLLLALMPAAGLQLVWVVAFALTGGGWLAQVNWANEAVASWSSSLLWVPQHVACLIACWVGLALLAQVVQRPRDPRWRDAGTVALASGAFASAVGLSLWVTLGAVATVGVWLTGLSIDRRWRAVGVVMAAGVLSAVWALPDLIDVIHNRSYGGPSIAPGVRGFWPVDAMLEPSPVRALVRLALLPLNYLFEFGVFLIGACLYWRTRRDGHSEVARLLTISAAAALFIASFFKSTIVNNDLGWRVILFAQLAALLWTTALVAPLVTAANPWERIRRVPRPLLATFLFMLGLGYGGTLYDLIGMRAYQFFGMTGMPDIERDPKVDREIRAAYEWLALPPARRPVLQHNPDAERSFGYGLYGRSRVAVSDRHNGPLFGAPPGEVGRRLDELIPVFSTAMPAEQALHRLRRNHIEAVIVTAKDPIWRDPTAWLRTTRDLYASPHVRVVPVPGASP